MLVETGGLHHGLIEKLTLGHVVVGEFLALYISGGGFGDEYGIDCGVVRRVGVAGALDKSNVYV